MKLTPWRHTAQLHFEVLVWRWGWAWPLGSLALLAAAGLEFFIIQPDRVMLTHLLAAAAVSAPAASSGTKAKTLAPYDGRATLEAMLKGLPEFDEQLRHLASLSEVGPLTLPRADYQHQPVAATPLVQWHITQPVQAPYPAVRRYIEAVLRHLPNASLDEISAQRADIGQGQVEARLRWSLWRPARANDTTGSGQDSGGVLTLTARQDLYPSPASNLIPDLSTPHDLFAAHSWAPPPAPPPLAVPDPAPQAPPPPFTYLGKKLQDQHWEVYVQHDDRSLVLREGDTADAIWRVDRISPTRMHLTYLPLAQTRTLDIGDDR